MRKGLTEVIFILDRSGSMSGLEADTIGGFNSMITKQKKEEGEAYISTVLFDDKTEVLYDRVPVSKIEPMNDKQYYVRGCTALLDALGGAIHHIGNVHKYAREEDRPEKTLFIITTDGMENSSHEYSYDKVKKMLEKQKKKYGWEFLFLGANIDAIEVAGRFGIAANRAINYESDRQGTQLNYEVLSRTVSEFRACECDDEADMDEMFEACCAPIMEDYKKRHRAQDRIEGVAIMKKNIWLDGMIGLVVGDALGVPVQFLSREEIKNRPEGLVTGMEAGGVYNMPEGTWSDDSSMALATLASIIDKKCADPADIMMRFVKWEMKGEYTPFGEAFDQGNTCSSAIYRFAKLPDIKTCGSTGEYANGNGALMRILPVCLYYYDRQKKVCTSEDEAIEGIHVISGLTHNHIRSKMCCGIYYFCVKSIIDGVKKEQKPVLGALLQEGIDNGLKYYGRDISNLTEMAYLGRLFHLFEFKDVPEEQIKTSGYVIDSIEAAVWCLITTDSYKECMLKAVNLGDDTDTVAAIAGGLAGLYYGYEEIPKDWLVVIKKREWIEGMCEGLE